MEAKNWMKVFPKGDAYYENYDRIFRKAGGSVSEVEEVEEVRVCDDEKAGGGEGERVGEGDNK